MGYVYKLTNIKNGKIYIGKTFKSVHERLKLHIKDSHNEKYKQRPLYQDMNKYGVDNFVIETLFESNFDIELCEKEKHYISEYNSFDRNYGYNQTLGGNGKSLNQYSDKEIVNYYLFEANFSMTLTKNHFGLDKGTIIRILKKYRITHLNESEAISLSYVNNKGMIAQIDKDSGNILRTYSNAREACIAVTGNDKGSSNIRDVIRGRHNTAYGYKWKRV